MTGEVHKLLEEFYVSVGIVEDNMLNRMKRRNVRIQLCLRSIDLGGVSEESVDAAETVGQVKEALKTLQI